MKIYLSKYWKGNCIFMFFINVIVIIGTILFYIDTDEPDAYIVVICALLYLCISFGTCIISLQFIRYTIKEEQQLVMYSFKGKKISFVNLELDIYYEILPLIEGTYSTQKFIVFSNIPFASYKKSKIIKLGKICKLIDKNGTQIIMPYGNQTIHNFLEISEWHSVN